MSERKRIDLIQCVDCGKFALELVTGDAEGYRLTGHKCSGRFRVLKRFAAEFPPDPDITALRKENERLRRERDEALRVEP